MKPLHLDMLRDLAVEYIPQAAAVFTAKGYSHYDVWSHLYTIAFLTTRKSTATALQTAAAELITNLTHLANPLNDKITDEQRKRYERWVIDAAIDLFELAERPLPGWLTRLETEEPKAIDLLSESLPQELPPPPLPKLPQPGTYLSNRETAKFLNVKERTLHTWSSMENGPLRPVKAGRKLTWAADDVLRLMHEGW